MSKFDKVYNSIKEGMSVVPAVDYGSTNPNKILTTPQQKQAVQQATKTSAEYQKAVEQAAKLLNLQPNQLLQILDAQKQQQQKPGGTTTQPQPAV